MIYDYANVDVVSTEAGFNNGSFSHQQKTLIRKFIIASGESEPFMDWMADLPGEHAVWFFRRPLTPMNAPIYIGFLWTEVQGHEKGTPIIRVHALYINPNIARFGSKTITRTFEGILSSEAKLHGIKEIGFYTKRDPDAFMRRLNRTAPASAPWRLDSYVITRKVP